MALEPLMGPEQITLHPGAPIVQSDPNTDQPVEDMCHDLTYRDGFTARTLPGAFATCQGDPHQEISRGSAVDGMIRHRFHCGNPIECNDDGDHELALGRRVDGSRPTWDHKKKTLIGWETKRINSITVKNRLIKVLHNSYLGWELGYSLGDGNSGLAIGSAGKGWDGSGVGTYLAPQMGG